MAHLTLQLGAALVIPFDAPRRRTNTGRGWRNRALRAAVAAGAAVGIWPAGWPLDDARFSVVGPDAAATLHLQGSRNESTAAFGLSGSASSGDARGLRDRSSCPDDCRHAGDAEP